MMGSPIRDEHEVEDPDSASMFLSIVVGFVAGMVVSVPAVVATAMSFMAAGVGHGRSVVAKMLYPYIFLSTKYGVSESSEIYAAALFQYPIYGMIICLFGRLFQTADQRRNGSIAAAVAAAIHLAAWLLAIFA